MLYAIHFRMQRSPLLSFNLSFASKAQGAAFASLTSGVTPGHVAQAEVPLFTDLNRFSETVQIINAG